MTTMQPITASAVHFDRFTKAPESAGHGGWFIQSCKDK
jgi:hypothetical protein